MEDNGNLYNNNTKRYLKLDGFGYRLVMTNGSVKKITLKKLYQLVYNKNFYIDTITDINGEIWREIKGTDRQYLVSNKGRIKSVKGNYAILMKQWTNEHGYYKITLSKNNCSYNKFIHILVADAFPEICGTPKGIDYQVHHINKDRTDNRAENLKYLSKQEHLKEHNKEITTID